MRPPWDHGKLVILTRWSYYRGSRKMTDWAFFFSGQNKVAVIRSWHINRVVVRQGSTVLNASVQWLSVNRYP